MAVPHVALSVSGLGEDQRLSAQAIDDNGRNYFAKVWEWDFRSGGFKEIGSHYFRLNDSSRYFLGLDVPADGGKFDLVFCVHRARTVEFVVRPPGAAP